MFFLIIYRWIAGYVSFNTNGGFPERFLNLCAANGIALWSAKIKSGRLYAKMLCRDYKNIRHFAFLSGVRPKIRRRHGLKCKIAHYNGRYGIAAGIAAFLIIINLTSMFVWNVNISGNERVKSSEITRELEKVGIYEGVMAKSIDTEAAKQQLLINMPSLSWCAVNIDGCVATVEIRETSVKNMEQKTSYPANIVAKTGGTIMSIRAYYGVPAVVVGEAVAKGDMLVNGAMETKTGSIIYCEARAEIIAQTVHTLSVTIPYNQTKFVDISGPKTRRIINFFGAEMPLYLGEIKPPYSVKRSTVIPTINSKRLPVKIYEAEFIMQQKTDYVIDEAEAKKRAEYELLKKAEKELNAKMKKQLSQKIVADEKGVTITADYLCTENIAEPKKILIN